MAGRATRMTPNKREELDEPNPYGRKKAWDEENKTGKPFVSADDSLAYASSPRTVVMDNMTGDEEEQATPEAAPENQQYQRTDWHKRHKDLKSHHDKTIEKHKREIAELQEQLQAKQPKYEVPTTPEELAAFQEKNPHVYNIVETVTHLHHQEEFGDLRAQIQNLQLKLAETESEKAWGELKAQVPDYEQIKSDPEFHNWVESQPAEIQAWVYENGTDVGLAVQAINLYKASRGMSVSSSAPPPISRTGADEAIQTRPGREAPATSGRIWRASEIGSLSPAQFDKYRDEIDLAFAEGRIERD
jgi:hypothetical protein